MNLLQGRERIRVVTVPPISLEKLRETFNVHDDHPMVVGVLSILQGLKEMMKEQIVPGQPNEARRDCTSAMMALEEAQEKILDVCADARAVAEGKKKA